MGKNPGIKKIAGKKRKNKIWRTNKWEKPHSSKRERGIIIPIFKKCLRCKKELKYHHLYCEKCHKEMIKEKEDET